MPKDEDPEAMLARLLPEARKLAEAKGDVAFKPTSGLAMAGAHYYRIGNVTGVKVVRQRGGWSSDLVFGDLPQGISNMIGSRVESPLPTREAAIDFARDFLATLIATEHQVRPPPPENAVFLYHGLEVPVPLRMLDILGRTPRNDRDYVLGRLAELDALVGPLDAAKANAMADELKTTLMAVSAMALLAGVMRWPLRVPPPEKH